MGRVWAQSDDERAAKAGELLTLKNHRVLRLYGADVKERGFAHGYLLANDIRVALESALKSLPNFGVEKFNAQVVPWSSNSFEWDADAKDELDGIFEGMAAKPGKDGMRSALLGRAITRDDLTAINVIADYFGPACSAFTVWGKMSADGGVLHGRTLEFPIGPDAVAAQIIVASEPLASRDKERPARGAWVAVGWPGLIVQYSGMNAKGLVVCLHDGYNLRPGKSTEPFFARGLLLRRMLESIDPTTGNDPALEGTKMAASHNVACGDLFHISWPNNRNQDEWSPPSAVLEFDPSDRKVEIRRPEDPAGSIVLTNHFCRLNTAIDCNRFNSIHSGLELLAKAGKGVGLIEARKLLMSAEQPLAAHSVYFRPDSLELHVALTRNNIMSPHVAPTAFTLKELLSR